MVLNVMCYFFETRCTYVTCLIPNTHRRRDSNVELSCVGVASAVCIESAISSRRLPTTADENLEPEHVENLSCRIESSWVVSAVCTRPSAVVTQFTILQPMWLAQKIGNWVTTDDWCVHTADTTQLDFVVGKLFRLVETRRDCRQLVANSIHTADATHLDSWVASASAVCIGLYEPR